MSNSLLSKQLNKLKQIQKSDPVLPDKASATFLFDFKNANKIDKDTIFELGYSSIVQLARADKKFIKYISNLFNKTSKYFQRETKLKSELTDIDLQIESLVVDLIDCFLFRPTHNVIEYLIKIFNINAYNPKLIVLAFLPYHETKYFVKLIQNINLELDQNFKFLTHFGKAGTVLLEEMLFKEILNNFDLMKEIFNFYQDKVIENSKKNIQDQIKAMENFNYDNNKNIKESEKFFKFLIKVIKYFFENINNNKRVDVTNFFILVINFIRINIKHFTILNEYTTLKSNGQNLFDIGDIESLKSQEVNYIIENICELIVLINSKYKISNDYANAIINDLINNFLFFKSKKSKNDKINTNNSQSAGLVLKTILLFISEYEEKKDNCFLALNKETLENFFDNMMFKYSQKYSSKNNNNTKDKTILAEIIEKLSEDYNFYPFLKVIINSLFFQIDSIFSENNNNKSLSESDMADSFELNNLSTKILQILKQMKIQKDEIAHLSENLMDLEDIGKNGIFIEALIPKKFSDKNASFKFCLSKLIEKSFMHIDNIYGDEFNTFLIKFFENKKNDKQKIIKYLKSLENYKLLSSNENNLFDLFVNLNTTNINSVSNAIDKIDLLISEKKEQVVKFTYNSLIGKFKNFDQEFLLKKILGMKNFVFILSDASSDADEYNDSRNSSNKKKYLRDDIIDFYFKILEGKTNLYSQDFVEKMSLFVFQNFIKDPNDEVYLKYFVYFNVFSLKISSNNLTEEMKNNKFLINLINPEYSLDKKIDEFVKVLSCANSIKSVNIINELLKNILNNKTAQHDTIVNLISLTNKLHSHENNKFKNNCSSSVYFKLVASIIEILKYLNLNLISEAEIANNKNLSLVLIEKVFYEITDSLISSILFHKDFLNLICNISFLILSSNSENIKALFEKIIKFIYKAEVQHFLTCLILCDKDTFIQYDENEDLLEYMNIKFLNNIIEFINRNCFKDNEKSKEMDLGFILCLVYLLGESVDTILRKNILEIFSNFYKQKIGIKYSPFNSLYGLVKEEVNNNDLSNKMSYLIIDIIEMIVDKKNEILINNTNLQKNLNNSNYINIDLYFTLFNYFISYSDEFTNFSIFEKLSVIIEKKLQSQKIQISNRNNINQNSNTKLKLNFERFDSSQLSIISKVLFSDSIQNNPSLEKLQEKVFSNILDFYQQEEECIVFIIQVLIDNFKLSNYETKYSQALIKKIALNPLISNIHFDFESSININQKIDKKNTPNKESLNELVMEIDNIYIPKTIDFVDFIFFIMQYNISASDICYFKKVSYTNVLEALLENLNILKDKKNKLFTQENIKEIIYYIYEIILKESIFSLDYSLITLELIDYFSTNSEIDANFLIMTNNLLTILSASALETENENLIRKYSIENDTLITKFICGKIEKIIILVCQYLSKNKDFYDSKNTEDDENENNNTMDYSYEYLNILNTLFLALNKSIIYLNQKNIERETVIRVINKTFEIFYATNSNVRQSKIKEDAKIDYEIGYKLKKDIFSVILNSIINFIVSLLGNKNDIHNSNDDLSIFYEYIQTLVKLTITNFDDDIYLDNILKKLLKLIENFDIKLVSCLFVNIYYYNIEFSFNKFMNKQEAEKMNETTLIEKFNVFYEIEKEQNTYYSRLISEYFNDILELNYVKFDEGSVLKCLLILDEIINTVSSPDNNIYYILDDNINNSNIAFFGNLRNILVNLSTRILSYCKTFFYLNDSFKLKENIAIYNSVISITSKILTNYKLSNKILNSNKLSQDQSSTNSQKSKEDRLVKYSLTNVFNKNLKIFEENFFDVLIESNILHYLLINLYNSEVENGKEIVVLRNFILSKYLELVKLDTASIQDKNIMSHNKTNSKKKEKTIEFFQEKYKDNILVFSKLINNFECENLKNYDNLSLIFSILTEIIVFSEKFKTLNLSIDKAPKIFNIIKDSKKLNIINSYINFESTPKSTKDDENKEVLPNAYYTSKFSIFKFMIKFFTAYDLKLYEQFNLFLKNISSVLDILYEKYYFSSNVDSRETLILFLRSFKELVESRSEFLSPIIENLIFKISLFYEEKFSAEVINTVFETIAKKQLFDANFKAVKFSFKNYDKIIIEQCKILREENNNITSKPNLPTKKNLKLKNISEKMCCILTYFNTAIKFADKLVITDMNLKIVKFIYRILLDKNYNNNNLLNKNKSDSADSLVDLSQNIILCLKSLVLKMNEKQFRSLFDQFLLPFFKEEVDNKNPDDIDIITVAQKYKLNHCIVTLQVFNELYETLSAIFVNYFEKYNVVLLQILIFVNSTFSISDIQNKKKKKDRNFFDDRFDNEDSKFTYLQLSSLVMKNIALVFKHDKNVLMQESIQEIFEPASNQVIIIKKILIMIHVFIYYYKAEIYLLY